MRLQISKSKHAQSLYIVKSTYDSNGKRSNKVVRKLGTVAELSKEHEDPIAWGHQVAKEMTEADQAHKQRIVISYDPKTQIEKDTNVLFNGGYLFLQKIYYQLGLDTICRAIGKRYAFDYDLNDILRTLIFGRILFPASKAATFQEAQHLLQKPSFESHDIYRALEVLAKENDFIQSEVYKHSQALWKRNDRILYYDCTNFFFEVEDELRRYGMSKEHRPNPIVQMGLFLDTDGIPLAFSIFPGNQNEQTSLKPLERRILRDFEKSRFVVCTDAGLAPTANRRFNTLQGRSFITVQSLKKMKADLRSWALNPKGWKCQGSSKTYNLDTLCDDEQAQQQHMDTVFYKERWGNDGGLEQRYIVSFSLKYKTYMEALRERQLGQAQNIVSRGQVKRPNVNDPARFVEQLHFDGNGEICDDSKLYLDWERVRKEAAYDGFYCVATNLEDPVEAILKVNRGRWEIEESFRTLKSEFKARPVYLSRQDRIVAHFLTCFLALYVFRILEKRLGEAFTIDTIIKELRQMNFMEIEREGYVPVYKRSAFTDRIHECFGFYTDFQITKLSDMRKIIRQTQKP